MPAGLWVLRRDLADLHQVHTLGLAHERWTIAVELARVSVAQHRDGVRWARPELEGGALQIDVERRATDQLVVTFGAASLWSFDSRCVARIGQKPRFRETETKCRTTSPLSARSSSSQNICASSITLGHVGPSVNPPTGVPEAPIAPGAQDDHQRPARPTISTEAQTVDVLRRERPDPWCATDAPASVVIDTGCAPTRSAAL